MSKFYTESVDLDKFKEEFAKGSLGNCDSLHACLYMSEQGQHNELKTFYDFISKKSELTYSERQTQFKTLVTYLSRLSDTNNIELEEEDLNLPINKKIKDYLQQIDNKNINDRHLGLALAKATLQVVDDNISPKEIQQTLDSKIHEMQEHMLTQVKTDAPRTNISFKKDGKTYFLEDEIKDIRSKQTGISIDQLKQGLMALNNKNNLGLTGEQIDYSILCFEQTSMMGPPIFNLIPKYINNNKGFGAGNITSESNFLIEIENNTVKINYNNAFEERTGSENIKPKELTLYTASANITELKGNSMQIGLASSHVPVTINLSSTFEAGEHAIPDRIKANDEPYDHVKEYCRIKVNSNLNRLQNANDQAQFLATQTPPKIIPYMISALKDVQKLNREQTAKLSAATSLLSIQKGHKLDLTAATNQLLSSVDGLEPARARRYIQELADNKKVKTNISFNERVSNFFVSNFDKLKGKNSLEKRLFSNRSLNEVGVHRDSPSSIISSNVVPTPLPFSSSANNSLTITHTPQNSFDGATAPAHKEADKMRKTFPPLAVPVPIPPLSHKSKVSESLTNKKGKF